MEQPEHSLELICAVFFMCMFVACVAYLIIGEIIKSKTCKCRPHMRRPRKR